LRLVSFARSCGVIYAFAPKYSDYVWRLLVLTSDGRLVLVAFYPAWKWNHLRRRNARRHCRGFNDRNGRALAAALAGALVTAFVISPKPQLWAFVAAAMYIVHPPVHSHWVLPPTSRDRLGQAVDSLWPAIVCVVAACIVARSRPRDPAVGVTH
jgi:hypothetical protein